MRIGDLARRCGVSTHVLRAWEKRYGVPHATRSTGGYRLYGAESEHLVRRIVELRDAGVPTSAAVSTVVGHSRRTTPDEGSAAGPTGSALRYDAEIARLTTALATFDERLAHGVLDDLLARVPLDVVICDIVVPVLQDIGDRWERGEASVALEHFASGLVRRRLSSLTMTWGLGSGPTALLACPTGELHDIGLLAYGLLLSRSGWRIRYMGTDTPTTAIEEARAAGSTDLTVVASTASLLLAGQRTRLQRLAQTGPLAIAGAGATQRLADELGAQLLPLDLREATVATNALRAAAGD